VFDKRGSSDGTKRFTTVSIGSGSVGCALPNWVVHLRLTDTGDQSANNGIGCVFAFVPDYKEVSGTTLIKKIKV
jgi:hypothetical protein